VKFGPGLNIIEQGIFLGGILFGIGLNNRMYEVHPAKVNHQQLRVI
jgi:hypothetical protein